MFQHQSLGIKVNIRVTKLVLLHSRPVSSKPFLSCSGIALGCPTGWGGDVGLVWPQDLKLGGAACSTSPGSVKGGKYKGYGSERNL